MGKTSLQAAFDVGFASVKGYVTRSFAEFEKQTEKLEKRIAELEAREMRYLGVWREGAEYGAQNFVTHGGSLWCCQERTISKPGTDSTWLLATKNGTFK